MSAKNMKELEQMLIEEINKAMSGASKSILADMHDETSSFYTQGNPKIYQRTGALKNTPKITAISLDKKSVSFEAYLDTDSRYTTGDNPSMLQVLNLANYGKPWETKSGSPARDTLGKKGFWERAENKMKNTLDSTITQFFE